MKMLTDRHEVAMAINFGKYPVLKIDLADADEYGLKGCKVRIDAGKFSSGEPYFIEATIRAFRDEKKLTTCSGCTVLSNTFTYSDYTDMVERAQAPLIKADQDVVIAIYDSRTKKAYNPVIVHTAPHVSKHCSTPLGFIDADMTPYLMAAGCKLED